jgi:uncharacterized protein (TIGR04255 family)
MTTSLPEFTDPPVVEVALSVQFEQLTSLRSAQIGLLWQRYRDRFPRIEEHASLEPTAERFGAVDSQATNVRVELTKEPPVHRSWFINKEGSQLIQIQQDRFIHNWRKVGDGDQYPRYENVKETFGTELREFERFCQEERIGALVPTQCEITYVNHIVAGNGWENHGDLEKVLTLFASRYSNTFLPGLEDARLCYRFMMPDEKGKPRGRLHVTVESALRRKDNQPMFLLNLVSRGYPDSNDIDGALKFLDWGREWVVRGFDAVTTETMHQVWGKTR